MIDASEVTGKVNNILANLPPAQVPTFLALLDALLQGRLDKAERLARLLAGTIAAKALIKRRSRK